MLDLVIPDKFVDFISDELGGFITGLENITVAVVFNATLYTGITDDGKKFNYFIIDYYTIFTNVAMVMFLHFSVKIPACCLALWRRTMTFPRLVS